MSFPTERAHQGPSMMDKNRYTVAHLREISEHHGIKVAMLTQQQHWKLESNEPMLSKVWGKIICSLELYTSQTMV